MTGFGVAEGDVDGGRLQVEIRTVNHRHFSATIRSPSDLTVWETAIRERVRREVDRGSVTVQCRWVDRPPGRPALVLDVERAREAMARLRELQMAVGQSGDIPIDLLARQPDVFRMPEEESEQAPSWDEVAVVVDGAAASCRATRTREGKVLAEDLLARVAELASGTATIRGLAPERIVRERDRLKRSVAELLDGRPAPEERIAQEIAILADRLDISEELVRLESHFAAVRELLAADHPIGKELGFLAQEMGREVNTVGSKANDATMARVVVTMKGELEKFREQLDNLE